MKKLSYILLKFNARSDELSPRFPNLQEVNLKKKQTVAENLCLRYP